MTWQGKNPSLPSLLLNSHMDVVPVFAVSTAASSLLNWCSIIFFFFLWFELCACHSYTPLLCSVIKLKRVLSNVLNSQWNVTKWNEYRFVSIMPLGWVHDALVAIVCLSVCLSVPCVTLKSRMEGHRKLKIGRKARDVTWLNSLFWFFFFFCGLNLVVHLDVWFDMLLMMSTFHMGLHDSDLLLTLWSNSSTLVANVKQLTSHA